MDFLTIVNGKKERWLRWTACYCIAKKNIDEDAIRLLQDYDWTGNIRELRNVVERLVILSAKTITSEDVKSYVTPR